MTSENNFVNMLLIPTHESKTLLNEPEEVPTRAETS
jgi:hypothetical protein